MKKSSLTIIVLLLLALTFCSFYGYESGFFYNTKPVIKHAVNFSLLIGIALIGYFGIKSYNIDWIKRLWIFAYTIVIIFLVSFGLFDSLYRISDYNLRHLIAGIRLFFTSPLPFSVLVYLSRVAGERRKAGERNNHL